MNFYCGDISACGKVLFQTVWQLVDKRDRHGHTLLLDPPRPPAFTFRVLDFFHAHLTKRLRFLVTVSIAEKTMTSRINGI